MKLITITGPSGAGKTTLLNELLKVEKFTTIVSHTTREPRAGEVEGQDYFYITREDFEARLATGYFIEHIEFHGKYYGVSLEQIEAAGVSGKIPLLIVDPHGLEQICNYVEDKPVQMMSIYVNGKVETLVSRFLTRLIKGGFSEDNKECMSEIEHAASRISKLYIEHIEWLHSFNSMCHHVARGPEYMYFKEYGAENEKEVMKKILESKFINDQSRTQ